MKAKIGVKYCGHCNPYLDGPDLIKELQRLNLDLIFTTYDAGNIDLLLIISACQADCATRPDYEDERIIVGGHTIDFAPVSPDQLPAVLSRKLRSKLAV